MKLRAAGSILLALCVSSVMALEVTAWVPPYAAWACLDNLGRTYGGYSPGKVLTSISLQFWVPTYSGGVNFASGVDGNTVSSFTSWAQTNQVDVFLTIYNGAGGWDWNLATAAFANNKTAFINALIATVDAHGLDGVDIDVEGNGVATNDHRNEFKVFISDLSAALRAKGKKLAVCTFADYGYDNVPEQTWWADWAGKVDFIRVMGYNETWESHSSANLRYSSQQTFGFNAGFDRGAITMGVPAWLDSWGGAGPVTHLNSCISACSQPAGVALWDMQLMGGAWQTSEVWAKLAQLRQLADQEKNNFTLLVQKTSGGSVTQTPTGTSFPPSTQITLNATPDPGFTFQGWSGDASGTNQTITITMDRNRSITAQFAPEQGGKDFDLIAAGDWETYKDAMGSTIAMNRSTNDVRIEWSLAKMPDANTYPYAGVSSWADGSFSGLTSVTVTYTSSTALYISLTDPVLADYGECYRYELAASSSPKNVSIALGDFAQPSWAEHKQSLDLAKVTALDFSAAVETSTSQGVQGTYTIQSLKVSGTSLSNGTGLRAPVRRSPSSVHFSIVNTRAGLDIRCNQATEAIRQVTVYNATGRTCFRLNAATVPDGAHFTIPAGAVDQSAIVFIRIESSSGNHHLRHCLR